MTVALSKLFAFAHVELSLTREEVCSMRRFEFEHIVDTWQQKQQRADRRVAALMTQLSNCIMNSVGVKSSYKIEDFVEDQNSRQMDDLEILARAKALFPKSQ